MIGQLFRYRLYFGPKGLWLAGCAKPCENVKRTVRAYLALARALVATAIALLSRATHVRVGTASSILFLAGYKF
jgi:hypothetical protein